MKKQFPIHPDDRHLIASVPWDLVEPHRDQAERNHSQSLECLASRGGLGIGELYYVLRDFPISHPFVQTEFALNYLKTRLALQSPAKDHPSTDSSQGGQS